MRFAHKNHHNAGNMCTSTHYWLRTQADIMHLPEAIMRERVELPPRTTRAMLPKGPPHALLRLVEVQHPPDDRLVRVAQDQAETLVI